MGRGVGEQGPNPFAKSIGLEARGVGEQGANPSSKNAVAKPAAKKTPIKTVAKKKKR